MAVTRAPLWRRLVWAESRPTPLPQATPAPWHQQPGMAKPHCPPGNWGAIPQRPQAAVRTKPYTAIMTAPCRPWVCAAGRRPNADYLRETDASLGVGVGGLMTIAAGLPLSLPPGPGPLGGLGGRRPGPRLRGRAFQSPGRLWCRDAHVLPGEEDTRF